MKTNPATQAPALTQTEPLPQLIAATANALPEQVDALARARAFAEPLLACETLDSGENTLVHADAVAAILKGIGGSEAMQAASYLVYACVHLNKPEEVIAKAFGDSFAALAVETTKLMRVQRQALAAEQVDDPAEQTENERKMLLAFSRDLRVVGVKIAVVQGQILDRDLEQFHALRRFLHENLGESAVQRLLGQAANHVTNLHNVPFPCAQRVALSVK